MDNLTSHLIALNKTMIGLRKWNPEHFTAHIEQINREFPLTQLILWAFNFIIDPTRDDVQTETVNALLGCTTTLTYLTNGFFSMKAFEDQEFQKKLLSLTNYSKSRGRALSVIQNLMLDKGEWPNSLLKCGLMFSLAHVLAKSEYPEVMLYKGSLNIIFLSLPISDSLESAVDSRYLGLPTDSLDLRQDLINSNRRRLLCGHVLDLSPGKGQLKGIH